MPLSPGILDSPVVLFLGAGASAQLGMPVMRDFVERLEKNRPSGLLRTIADHRQKDLEAILEDLEAMISLEYVGSFKVPPGGFLRAAVLGSPSGPTASTEPLVYSQADAEQLLSTIHYEIIRQYGESPVHKVTSVYGPLIDAVFAVIDPATFCLPIFTTNYDLAVEEFHDQDRELYHLVDGFRYGRYTDSYWDSKVFDEFILTPGKRNIVLFKLHGSADWIHDKRSQKILRGPATRMDLDRYNNVVIFPARRKVATADPYFTAYDYYQKCMDRAKLCLTVGYSFRDYDALMRLKAAAISNDLLTLALLDPNAGVTADKLCLPDPHRVERLSFWFGVKDVEKNYLAEVDRLLKAALA